MHTNLTISSPISGVKLMLLLRALRASDVEAPSDLQVSLRTLVIVWVCYKHLDATRIPKHNQFPHKKAKNTTHNKGYIKNS